MLFNSVDFVAFFSVVALLYFCITPRYQWALLLVASYLFYMAWNPAYLLLILLSTVVDYGAGLRMGALARRGQRRKWLWLSLAANLGLLFTFKYLTFAGETLRALLGLGGIVIEAPYLDVLLPVGISFYTFQTLSYSFEVYRGRQKPIRHLGRFALYVSFFPQLVAGPIERPQRLLPQLEKTYAFDYDRVVQGLRLVLWGLFKKVVIADRLSVVVDAVYAQPERCPGSLLAIATIFFAFQIYCDFSGYSDIAIGTARVLGINLMQNFDRPYLASSIAEFWRRWHISLSTWFRDYVYIPLGGSRGSRGAWLLALLATFGLSGLWHGAQWTFVVWGLLHAFYYVAGRMMARPRARFVATLGLGRFPRFLHLSRVLITFTLVCVGWVFFRADTMGDAVYIFSHVTQGWTNLESYGGFARLVAFMDISPLAFRVDTLLIFVVLFAEGRARNGEVAESIGGRPWWIRWTMYVLLAMAIMNLGIAKEIPFVYFQF